MDCAFFVISERVHLKYTFCAHTQGVDFLSKRLVRTMALEIRPVREDDCEIVRQLIFDLARYERLEDQCHATVEGLHEELFGPRAVIRCVIAWERDEVTNVERPVGFALYFFNFSTFLTRRGLYLEDLYVVEDARRKGYGRALIRYLANTAIKEGCGRFDWSVLDWNQPAIDFYERMGAVVMPDWRLCRLAGDALKKAAQD